MVYIGAQHPQHKAAVLLSLAAGKAVLCEKPLGVNTAEVHEMVAEARSRGLFLMEVRATKHCLPLLSMVVGGHFWRNTREGFIKS